MLYSKIGSKTLKKSKTYEFSNATWLIKVGYIRQVTAGVYTFLYLGLRVLQKIENIVREEMNKIGTEIYMSTLSPTSIWEKTGRLQKIDVLLKAVGANQESQKLNNSEYIVNPTHEEVLMPIAKEFIKSYKDLPAAYYQIQTKFRNEARPKAGLLRGREFRMKDLYSFHANEKDFSKYYENAKKIYMNVFRRVGLGDDTVIALASGGVFTDKYSHEFQTKCDAGEDLIFYDYVNNVYYNREVAPSKASPFKQNEEPKHMQEIYKPGLIGVEDIASYLKIPVKKTTKTLLYKADNDFVLAAVRGDYEVNEEKLRKVLKAKDLRLATDEEIKKVLNSEVGYVGIINVPKGIKVIIDDSVVGRVNIEMGGNKTGVHVINVNFGRDIPQPDKVYDIKLANKGDIIPQTNKKYKVFKAAEVGNIFPLETRFSKLFECKFKDKNGSLVYPIMGCYGIGTTRLMGVIAENYNDKNGLIWPISVAPFHVHLISLGDKPRVLDKALKVYKNLQKENIEVLWDDRVDATAGEKFSDADLIGVPYRVVVSSKNANKEKLEIKNRKTGKVEYLSISDLRNLISQEIKKYT